MWLQMSGDKDGARRLFEEALRLDPANPKARELLGGRPGGEPAPARVLTPDAFVLPPLPDGGARTGWESKSGPGEQIAVHHEARDALGILTDEGERGRSSSLDEELGTLLAGVDDLLSLDDHTGALELLQKAEELAPTHPEVARRREESEAVVERMLHSRIGPMSGTPRVLLKQDEVIWLNLDHRAGFVLAQIDGGVTFDDLFALSGMSRLDTARILVQLLDEGVITV